MGCVERRFNKVDDLLFHLSVIHFSKDLLEVVPYKEGTECEICRKEGGIEGVVREKESMSTHLTHQGVEHRQVLAFLPPHIAISLRQMDEETEASFRTYPAKEGIIGGKEIVTSEQDVDGSVGLDENKPEVDEKTEKGNVKKKKEDRSEGKSAEAIEATSNVMENTEEQNVQVRRNEMVEVLSAKTETKLSIENVKQLEEKVEESKKPSGVRCSLCI